MVIFTLQSKHFLHLVQLDDEEKSKFETVKDLAWVYAVVNGRLGEVYFEKGEGVKGIFAHGYLNKNHLWESKRDKALMEKDIKNHRFTYRKKKYYRAKSTT